MALSTVWKLGKFKALSRALKGKVQAVGTLECLWACACQSGDDLIGTADDVESECEWKGKRGVLAKVLEDLRWIDLTPRGYIVHDFWDHAPGYVKRKRARLDSEHNKGRTKDGQRTDTERTKCVPRGVEGSGGEYPLPPEGGGAERTRCASGIAGDPSRTAEQPAGEIPEAFDVGALIGGLFDAKPQPAATTDERRAELERQKQVILSGNGGGA